MIKLQERILRIEGFQYEITLDLNMGYCDIRIISVQVYYHGVSVGTTLENHRKFPRIR